MSKSARTIEELATKFGISPEALKHTIKEYNEISKDKKDPFRKVDSLRQEISEPPFYGFNPYSTPITFFTLGGLVVDGETGLVIHRITEKPIKGLYAGT